MKANRRDFLRIGAFLTAGSVARHALAQQEAGQHVHESSDAPAMRPMMEGVALPVETPDVPSLVPRIEDGVKVFNLVAEPVRRDLIPGRTMDVWGYNGSCPGPTIQVTQGDRVRIILDNHLPEPTTIHWHGFEIPVEMDGMPYISQKPVPPGGRFVYEFTVHQEGTYFYHSHGAMQEMLGMIGMFIMHAKVPYQPRVDQDFGIILQGWALLPNSTVPNTAGMEFN